MKTSQLERATIYEMILDKAMQGIELKEQIMMDVVAVSSFELDQCLSVMIRNGLLMYDSETRSYRISEKGIGFLETIRQISELDNAI